MSEAALLSQLSHPSIPGSLGSFHEGEGIHTRLYLAQELVEGESLQERLQHHRFTEAEALAVARQVLATLVYLQGLSPPWLHRSPHANRAGVSEASRFRCRSSPAPRRRRSDGDGLPRASASRASTDLLSWRLEVRR